MTNIDNSLDMAANIKGAYAVALVDYDSGMTLGSRGGSPEFDLEVAAPGQQRRGPHQARRDGEAGPAREHRRHPDHAGHPVPPDPADPRAARREAVLLPRAQPQPGQPGHGPARPAGHREGVLPGQPRPRPAHPGRPGLLPVQRGPLTAAGGGRTQRITGVGRHRHAVTVRADGLGVVLGPLLNDPRVVLAALVDVDSGMVLDACTPDRPGAQYWGADLEMAGAGHAELARVAL